MNVQHFILVGRATKDAEVLTSKAKKNFAKFSLAVNEFNSKTKEEKVYFYNVLVFGKTAEKAVEHVKKGSVVMVTGRPEAEAYLPKGSKEPKASITVLADTWNVLK